MRFGDHMPFGRPHPTLPAPGSAGCLLPPGLGEARLPAREAFFVQPTSAISARSGLTLGSGTAKICALSNGTLTVTSQVITIYNPNLTAISQLTATTGAAKILEVLMICGIPVAATDDCTP
jgi:hypothetical protein